MQNPVPIISSKYPDIVIPLLENARHSIRVIVYDWRFYDSVLGSAISKFNNAIVSARKRGVNVRALVNSDAVVAQLRALGCEAKRTLLKKTLHTKMLIVDGEAVVIGSHNYTQNAFSFNEEASVLVYMPASENGFVQYFDTLWEL